MKESITGMLLMSGITFMIIGNKYDCNIMVIIGLLLLAAYNSIIWKRKI